MNKGSKTDARTGNLATEIPTETKQKQFLTNRLNNIFDPKNERYSRIHGHIQPLKTRQKVINLPHEGRH